MLYGYMRVSTLFEEAKDKNQTFDRQIKILTDYGIKEENIFKDRITGGSEAYSRPGFDEMMGTLVAGDTIIVSEMSRFSRSLQDMIETCNDLMKRQIGVKFIKEKIEIGTDGLSPINKFIFQLFGAFNEFEKSLIQSRIKEGLAAKKAQGVKLGRPTKFDPSEQEKIIFDFKSGATYIELMERYHISKATLAKIVKPYSKERSKKLKVIAFNNL